MESFTEIEGLLEGIKKKIFLQRERSCLKRSKRRVFGSMKKTTV